MNGNQINTKGNFLNIQGNQINMKGNFLNIGNQINIEIDQEIVYNNRKATNQI